MAPRSPSSRDTTAATSSADTPQRHLTEGPVPPGTGPSALPRRAQPPVHRMDRHNERVLRWLTAGESHGPALVAILEGLPAGVRITRADIVAELARRRAGYGRGARMAFEGGGGGGLRGGRHRASIGAPRAGAGGHP